MPDKFLYRGKPLSYWLEPMSAEKLEEWGTLADSADMSLPPENHNSLSAKDTVMDGHISRDSAQRH